MDSSQPAWRVFDTPGSGDASAGPPTKSGAHGGSNAAGAADGGAAMAGALDMRIALAGVAGAFGIGALAFVLLGNGGAGATTIDGPGVAAGSSFEAASFGAGGGELVIDVAGAVVNPGLYHVDAGARVGDAVDAAGGFSPRVDVDRVGSELNLAAPLADGQQVRVPSRDDPEPVAGGGGTGGAGSGGTPGGAGGGTSPGALINLNSASQSELESLPGIGPVTATKILESRAGQAFRTVEELRERGLVGEKTFESLKSLVTVG